MTSKDLKQISLFYEETPQPRSDPPIVRLAGWPKTAGEFGKCIGADFGKKVRVERWIEIKGSRENELRDAELLVVVAVCQRSPTKS